MTWGVSPGLRTPQIELPVISRSFSIHQNTNWSQNNFGIFLGSRQGFCKNWGSIVSRGLRTIPVELPTIFYTFSIHQNQKWSQFFFGFFWVPVKVFGQKTGVLSYPGASGPFQSNSPRFSTHFPSIKTQKGHDPTIFEDWVFPAVFRRFSGVFHGFSGFLVCFWVGS